MRAFLLATIAGCTGAITGPAQDDARQLGFLQAWGQQGSGDGEFSYPIGIAIDREDIVYVSDYRNSRIQKFDVRGAFLGSFATLPFPGAFTIDSDGSLVVSHGNFFGADNDDKIAVYDPTGTLVRQFGRPPTVPCGSPDPDGELDKPGGIAIGLDGRLYVADQQNHRVQIFDREGNFLAKWGEYGAALGEFGMPGTRCARVAGPHFIAISRDGDVWTTEGSVRRVQRFTPDGVSIAGWVKNTEGPGGFAGGMYPGASGPVALAFDRDGNLWISSPSQGLVQQFAPDGTFLQAIGAQGSEPGQFNAPHALALDSRGDLYVVDLLNHRVQKFAVAP